MMTSSPYDVAPPYESMSSYPYPRPLLRHTYTSGDAEIEFGSHASNPGSVPIFFTGSVVAGSISLRTSGAADMPKSIIVKIEGCGADHTGGQSLHDPFWRQSTTIYPPRSSFERRVHGKHVFPFSLEIPKTMTPLSPRGSSHQHDLPPTFTDQLAYSIHYTMFVEFKRGLMRLDESIQIRFLHFPIARPARPMSILRLNAYSRGLPLPPPSVDPDGYASSIIPIKGRLLNGAAVSLQCELCLTQPTAYLPGKPLHFFLKLFTLSATSQNSTFLGQAIDILSAPASIKVSMQRHATLSSAGNDHISEIIATATTWRLRALDRETDKGIERIMQGEMALPPDLLPGFVFPPLRLEYRVNLTIDAPGFSILPTAPHAQRGSPLLSYLITIINTSLIGEPLPPYYAPHPQYVSARDVHHISSRSPPPRTSAESE